MRGRDAIESHHANRLPFVGIFGEMLQGYQLRTVSCGRNFKRVSYFGLRTVGGEIRGIADVRVQSEEG